MAVVATTFSALKFGGKGENSAKARGLAGSGVASLFGDLDVLPFFGHLVEDAAQRGDKPVDHLVAMVRAGVSRSLSVPRGTVG